MFKLRMPKIGKKKKHSQRLDERERRHFAALQVAPSKSPQFKHETRVAKQSIAIHKKEQVAKGRARKKAASADKRIARKIWRKLI